MVISDEERKAKKREYGKEYRSRPEVKARKRMFDSRPENRAKRKEYLKEYYSRPEVKSYCSAKAKEHNARHEIKARRKLLSARPENVAKRKEYRSSPKGKATAKAYNRSSIGKARFKKFKDKPETKAKRVNQREKLKLEVFSWYSKFHSNSDIPCCRCCKESNHIEFLQVDHVLGKKHLPEKEEKLHGTYLHKWLKQHDYPPGFQVLCANCNFAKGMYGKCPHERN